MLSLMNGAIAHEKKDVFWRRNGSCFPTEYWSYPIFREQEHIGAVVTSLT